jgi:hypothetical protein
MEKVTVNRPTSRSSGRQAATHRQQRYTLHATKEWCMSDPKNRESIAHNWMVAIVGGALATVLSTYLLYALPPEKLRGLFSGRQAGVSLQGQEEGWAYFGTFENGIWSERTAAVGPKPPVTGDKIRVTSPLNLRKAKPVWPFYRLGDVAGQLNSGEIVEVVEVDEDVGRHRVWAFVRSPRP